MSTSNPLSGERWHGLDAVRAFALLLGIVLHGIMSFMTPRVWLVWDSTPEVGFNVAFYVIHMFRMITFFVLAGFFARLLMQKRGLGGFIGNRLKRVGVPFLIFWPLMSIAILAVMIGANMPAAGAVAGARAAPPTPPSFDASNIPLMHLWFLYVLLLLCMGAALLKFVTDVTRVGGVLGRLLDPVIRVLTRFDLITIVLAAPIAAGFWANPAWLMWFGIQTPDMGLFPSLMAVAGFVTAFTFGWWLHRNPELLDHMASRFWVHGIAAVGGTWWCLTQVGPSPVMVPAPGAEHPLYCLTYPLTAWSWAVFLIGGGHALIRRENPLVRFVSDASYWIYIVHLPLVMLMQWWVKTMPVGVGLKAAIVVLGAFAMGLLSYALFVRYTFIGSILNGRRRRKAKDAPISVDATA